jgi:hypothetical protein
VVATPFLGSVENFWGFDALNIKFMYVAQLLKKCLFGGLKKEKLRDSFYTALN